MPRTLGDEAAGSAHPAEHCIVLVSSPFVGSTSWAPLQSRLPGSVIADYGVVRGPGWYQGLARDIATEVDDRPWIAVLHSGAGGYAPALAAVADQLVGWIFLDAILPYPGRSYLDSAPTAFASNLRKLTNAGILAPWNAWFPSDPTPRLIPDEAIRAAFIADLPRIPFEFLEIVSPTDDGWRRLPAAYLQLSDAYADEAVQARSWGWPVEKLELNHLAAISHPDLVGQAIRDLANAF